MIRHTHSPLFCSVAAGLSAAMLLVGLSTTYAGTNSPINNNKSANPNTTNTTNSKPSPTILAPDQLVQKVSNEVLQAIKTNKDLQSNPTKLQALLNEKLLPHFNFTHMTQLAMGRNWGKASPEQQKQLTAEFQSLLVRTYSGALQNYQDRTIEYKPLRMQSEDKEVTVKTQVLQPGGQPIPIDYSLESTPQGWKAFDVIVGGVSLVTNYREEFNNIIRAEGVEGLVKQLSAKNKANGAAQSS